MIEELKELHSQQASTFQTCLSETKRSIEHLLSVLEQRHEEELAKVRASDVDGADKPASEDLDENAVKFPLAALEEHVPSEHLLIKGANQSENSEYRLDHQGSSLSLETIDFGEACSSFSSYDEQPCGTQSQQSAAASRLSSHNGSQHSGHQLPLQRPRAALSLALDRLSQLFHSSKQSPAAPPSDLDSIRSKIDNVIKGPYSLLESWGTIISHLMEDASLTNAAKDFRTTIQSSESVPSDSTILRGHQGCSGSFIVRPTNWKRLCWDMFSIVVVLHDIAMLPMMIYEFEETDADQIMFWFTLTFWTLDIIFSFGTGYQVEGKIEMRCKLIAYRYLRGWFLIDILCVAPDWIVLLLSGGRASQHITRLGKAAKVLRVFRGLRILRVFRLLRAWNGLHEGLTNQYMISFLEFAKFVLVLLFMSHYSACAWYGISKLTEHDGWVHEFEEMQSATSLYMYLTSLHWATSQLHGSIEIYPNTNLERSYAIFYVFVGLIAASVFVSAITNLLLRLQRLRQETFLKTHKLLRYLEQNHITADLTSRIQCFARHATDVSAMRVNEVDLLKCLPPNLLTELDHEIKTLAVNASYPLKKVMRLFPDGRKGAFLDVFSHPTISPGRFLFENLDASGKMFILWKGKVMYNARRMCPVAPQNSTKTTVAEVQSSKPAAKAEAVYETADSRQQSINFGMDTSCGRSSMTKRSSVDFSTFAPSRSVLNLKSSMSFSFGMSDGAWDDESEPVEGCCCLAEMSLWTTWHHRGDCLISGHPTIFSIDAQHLGELLTTGLSQDCNLNLAFFISNYAAHYIEWMRSVPDSALDDLSMCPHSRWKRLYTDYAV